ncbi:MAG: hypothetical protein CME35_00860 [Gramella sp.]|nr:hypothetical protein [Christiangramia sp.]|tara:strand:- start:3431 stop:3748 length:318 start_codon:yes stop_codon:yes gene_type:complete
MKIERKLKYGSFGWNDETKMFSIEHKGQSIKLNKIYAFAFLRFAFSVAQRNWFRKIVKPKVEKEVEKAIICDKNIRGKEFEAEQFSLFDDKHKEVKFNDISKMSC